MTFAQNITAFFDGVGIVSEAIFGVLCFAWAFSAVLKDMQTGDWLVYSLKDELDPRILPFLCFLLSGVIALFTGSSWGTMAVMFPLVVPLAMAISNDDGSVAKAAMATILAGSVWGDHCSPISDTTILSSMASGCDLQAHVTTQLPYAMTVAFFWIYFWGSAHRLWLPGYSELFHCPWLLVFVHVVDFHRGTNIQW